MIHLVCVCVTCPHDNLKTIAVVYFLFGSYVDWRTIHDEFACQGLGRISKGSVGI